MRTHLISKTITKQWLTIVLNFLLVAFCVQGIVQQPVFGQDSTTETLSECGQLLAKGPQQPFPSKSLPASGISSVGESFVDVRQLDINLRANRVILNYEFTNSSDTQVSQDMRFVFPRLSKSIVLSDPVLGAQRRFNFLRVRVRRDGERIELASALRMYANDRDVTPDSEIEASGKSLCHLVSNLFETVKAPDLVEQPLAKIEFELQFNWTEVFEPGQTKQIALSYQPYTGFLSFAELKNMRLTKDQLRNWRSQLNDVFCTAAAENSDANEKITSASVNGWLQTMVFNFDENHSWGKPIEELTLSVDPNFYDQDGTRFKKQVSYPAFCDRQGRSLDAEGVVRRSWHDVHLTKSVPILFTHSVIAGPEVVGPSNQQDGESAGPAVTEIFQQLDSLFEPDQCEPANGWILPCSDMRVLSKADIKHLRPSELLRAQYEIRARKGSYFADPAVQQYFQQFPWYEPFTKNPPLSDIEQANSALLQNTRVQQLDGIEGIGN